MEGVARFSLYLLPIALVGLFTGCSQSGTGAPPVADNSPGGIRPPASSASEADSAAATATAAAAEFRQLTETAIRAEMEHRFADAVQAWMTVEQRLTGAFGKNSWQVRNAQLARETAEQESRFTPHQVDRLTELTGIQHRIGEAIAAGQHASALQLAEQTAPETAALFGARSWMQAKQLVQLARLRQLSGDRESAIRTYQQAAALILELAGPVHPELESLHAWLATCFEETGNADLALANLRKAAGIALEAWGETSEQYALRANELGVALNRRGDWNAGLRVLRAAEAIRVRSFGEEHPLVAHSRLNLSAALMGIGEYAEALRLTELAEPVLRGSGPSAGAMLVQALRQRSALLMLLQRPADAEPVIRELLAMVESGESPDNRAIAAELQYRLGVCLARQGRFADAVQPTQQSLSVRSQMLGPDHADTGKSRDLLVSLFERTGQTARADELRGSVRQTGFAIPPNR